MVGIDVSHNIHSGWLSDFMGGNALYAKCVGSRYKDGRVMIVHGGGVPMMEGYTRRFDGHDEQYHLCKKEINSIRELRHRERERIRSVL